MFNSLEIVAVSQFGFNHGSPLETRRKVSLVYERALRRGKTRALWSRITGGDNSLRDMGQISQMATPRPARYMGVANIPLAKIVGSENRVSDFDNAFNPLNEHNRDRWINIAVTRRNGTSLPPVELIQVGEEYYVRDGHHRISVAKAANQAEIEARIAFVLDI